MPAATIQAIDASTLSTESKYALDILQNLSIEQVNALKQRMKLGNLGVVGPQTLATFEQLCKSQGIDLTEAGVNAFKTEHRLGNCGQYQGVIGPQTADVYFREIMEDAQPSQETTGDLNAAIAAAAKSLLDMCTADGPDDGNNACAWSVNQVLQKAGIPLLGENPNYVPSLLEALQNGRGQRVDRAHARAGDLVIAYGEAHIGIGLDDGCVTVLSNSSSRARFRWESDTDFDGYYGGSSIIYRLVK